MRARAEITGKYAGAYAKASKKDKGRMLDEVCSVTGWSRDNARRRLVAAAGRPPGRGRPEPGGRARKYSYDALKILQRVWAASGGQCGKYLKESMPLLLDLLEGAGELDGEPRYGPAVRAGPGGHERGDHRPLSRPGRGPRRARPVHGQGPVPCCAAPSRSAGPAGEVEAEPGFFEVDTVAHCGPVLKGEFARTVNMTDVLTGWTFTRSIRNNAEKHIISAPGAAVDAIPFPVLGMDFDNGSEFINHGVVRWAGNLDIYFTRSRPYRKNDQATIESKNNHVVRRYAFYYRYDTDAERQVLNRLWELVDTRVNFLTPTRKPIGWGADRAGRRKRLYDRPRTPPGRLLDTDALTDAQKDELIDYRNRLNPAVITRRIIELQDVLVRLAKDKTDQLHLAQIPSILPDVRKGIRVRRASPAAPDHAGSST